MIKNLQWLSDKQDEEEVWALYSTGNYSIAGRYKRFSIQSSEWHKLGCKLKDHVQKFRSFVPGKTDLFFKPRNSGREPCYQELSKRSEPNLIIDCHESNANSDKKQTSSQQEASLRFTDPRYSLLKHFINLNSAYCTTNSS